jgi:hypothetical protein
MIDETHDPKRTTWVEDANAHADFPIQNLPFGLFSPKDEAPQAGRGDRRSHHGITRPRRRRPEP